MAFSMTLVDRISFGNQKLRIYTITDAQSAGSTHTMDGFDTVHAVKATNNTDSTDTFKESVGAHSAASTKNQVTFTPGTNDDDGHAWIWGN